jgi:beta-D-xylosidase 4
LLNTILRGHWAWNDDNQFVVSDCDAVSFIYSMHHYTMSYQAAVAAAFNAGTDNICTNMVPDTAPQNSFDAGSFSQNTLDKMMIRQYQGLIRAGYFDGPNRTYRSLGSGDLNSASAMDLVLKIAQEGIVVLKNDGFLPNSFSNAAGPVGMIGFWADAGSEMLGGYSGAAPYKNSPIYAAKQMGIKVNYAIGPIAQSGSDTWTSNAMAAAQNSTTIIFFAGIDNSTEIEQVDRTTISWPAPQLALVQKLTNLGKRVVIVKMGSHIDDTPLLNNSNIKAIV